MVQNPARDEVEAMAIVTCQFCDHLGPRAVLSACGDCIADMARAYERRLQERVHGAD